MRAGGRAGERVGRIGRAGERVGRFGRAGRVLRFFAHPYLWSPPHDPPKDVFRKEDLGFGPNSDANLWISPYESMTSLKGLF